MTAVSYQPRLTMAGVEVSECTECGRRAAPPTGACPWCRGPVRETHVEAEGTVWSSTVVHIEVRPGQPAPFGMAYVDLGESGPRVLVVMEDAVRLPRGTRVRMEAAEQGSWWARGVVSA